MNTLLLNGRFVGASEDSCLSCEFDLTEKLCEGEQTLAIEVRTQGTKTVDRNGKTTWRDAAGRIRGTATTDRNGKTTYRDGGGRLIGTRKVQ